MSNIIIVTYKKNQHLLNTVAQNVTTRMENNADFPNPPEALTRVKTLQPQFQSALADAASRDKLKVAIKNDLKKALLAALDELAEYVTSVCKGDRVIALGSGFDVPSEYRGKQSPSIGKLEVILGLAGEATTRCREMTGAKAYTHQYTTEPPHAHTNWIGEGSSYASFTFQGLASHKPYWFRVVAVGSRGQRGYSPVVVKTIQ